MDDRKPRRRVVFRVDGDGNIGLGHIVRCCALSEMLKNDFDCYFYLRRTSKEILEDVKKYSIGVFELENNISYEEEGKEWIQMLDGEEIIVLDGYHFDTAYQSLIKSKGCILVCIDDIHSFHFVADVVINYAPGASENDYSVEPYTKLYLGAEYVLLKEIFLKEASITDKNYNTENSPVLICLGGADPNDITKKTLNEVIHLLPEHKINVIVGSAYRHLPNLEKICTANANIFLHINVDSEKMIALMRESHIAVTSASTIALEYICVKGNLFLKCIVDNQRRLYKALLEKGCAQSFKYLSKYTSVTTDIENQYSLIDGESKNRVLKIFENLLKRDLKLIFKRVEEKDVQLLYGWINDDSVREQSLSNETITYENHLQWFSKKQKDPDCYLYIVYQKELPVGMIRFDKNSKIYMISYLVDKSQRNRGVGLSIVSDGIRKFLNDSSFRGLIRATVKASNPASLKIFEKLEFTKDVCTDKNLIYFEKRLNEQK